MSIFRYLYYHLAIKRVRAKFMQAVKDANEGKYKDSPGFGQTGKVKGLSNKGNKRRQ